jgi:hypothetical protein
MNTIDNNHRNAILESAALVAEQIDNGPARDEYDHGYERAKSHIAAAIRALKVRDKQA